MRGVVLLTQGWIGYARASANAWTIAAALLTLVAFSVFAVLFLRWFERRALAPRRLETRFSKSLYALLTLLRIALTAPAVVAAAVLIIDAFGLMPDRIKQVSASDLPPRSESPPSAAALRSALFAPEATRAQAALDPRRRCATGRRAI